MKFALPYSEMAEVIYLADMNHPILSYLQHKRMAVLGELIEDKKRMYYENLDSVFVPKLCSMVLELERSFDGIIYTPSNGIEHKKYFDALLVSTGAKNISKRWSRIEDVSAGEGASAEQVYDNMRYSVAGDEHEFKSILIVDDILNQGRTASAIVTRARETGFTAQFSLAVALWVARESKPICTEEMLEKIRNSD